MKPNKRSEQYHERIMQGLCGKCGKEREGDAKNKSLCKKCAERQAKSMRDYREMQKIYNQIIINLTDEEGKSDQKKHEKHAKEIIQHPCFGCEWGEWLGDKMFCPFMEGICMRGQYKKAKDEIIECNGEC